MITIDISDVATDKIKQLQAKPGNEDKHPRIRMRRD